MISNSIATNFTSQQPLERLKEQKGYTSESYFNRVSSFCRRSISFLSGEATGEVQFALQVSRKETIEVNDKKCFTFSLLIEIERCTDLLQANIFGQLCSPCILVRCDETVVGITAVLKPTRNPIWHDECYDIPFSMNGSLPLQTSISVEVWHMRDDGHFNDCIGCTSFQVIQRFDDVPCTECCVFKRKLNKFKESIPGSYEVVGSHLNECNDNEVKVPLSQFGRITACLSRSRLLNRPSPRKNALSPQLIYKIQSLKCSNPHPFRRRSCFEDATKLPDKSMLESTLFRALSLVCGYLGLGIIGFSYIFESWSIRDSMYFCVVTFTTVGFGDVRPRTNGGKLFSCFIALAGIGIIGIALGYIGQNIVHAQLTSMGNVDSNDAKRDNVSQDKDDSASREVNNVETSELDRYEEGIVDISNPHSYLSRSDTLRSIHETARTLILSRSATSSFRTELFMTTFPLLIMILIGTFVIGRREDWSLIDSIYWCISTGTSVGYGDFAPQTNEMRWFCIFFIPISVGIISAVLGRVANLFVEQEISKANEKLLKRELTIEDLERMNVDGEVSLLEFVEHMLKIMQKVDQKLLDDLHDQFYRLDADGSGALQEDDLILLAEQKLQTMKKTALQKYEESKLKIRSL